VHVLGKELPEKRTVNRVEDGCHDRPPLFAKGYNSNDLFPTDFRPKENCFRSFRAAGYRPGTELARNALYQSG
jgi:hypothetical protein